ncbi:MAG: spore gernimation protein [Desulfosporosinus sp. BRH_c37]|nr:MAG: spore gernimation protein [Desulfosporosinus sp. BRH_c37]
MKIRIWNSFLMGVVLFSLIFIAGCGTLETLVNKDGASTAFGDFIGGKSTTVLPAATSVSTSSDAKSIFLYFADSTGKYLVKEQRLLPQTTSVARETVNQWLKGPDEGTNSRASVPTTTVLLDIAIKDNIAIVDLSKEFLKPNSNVSPEVALYGLVNTLTQFATVKQVQIRIEGKALLKYGAIDATKLINKASLIKAVAAPTTNPIVPNTNKGLEVTTPGNTSSRVFPESPSSINLFNYPPSST